MAEQKKASVPCPKCKHNTVFYRILLKDPTTMQLECARCEHRWTEEKTDEGV